MCHLSLPERPWKLREADVMTKSPEVWELLKTYDDISHLWRDLSKSSVLPINLKMWN